jgi:hypothetical protein
MLTLLNSRNQQRVTSSQEVKMESKTSPEFRLRRPSTSLDPLRLAMPIRPLEITPGSYPGMDLKTKEPPSYGGGSSTARDQSHSQAFRNSSMARTGTRTRRPTRLTRSFFASIRSRTVQRDSLSTVAASSTVRAMQGSGSESGKTEEGNGLTPNPL